MVMVYSNTCKLKVCTTHSKHKKSAATMATVLVNSGHCFFYNLDEMKISFSIKNMII